MENKIKLAKLFLVFLISASLISPQDVYSLAPDGKEGLAGISAFTSRDWERFRDEFPAFVPGKDNLPPWLRPILSSVYEADTKKPEFSPPMPFPNMETGAGVKEPEWLELSLIGISVLEICHIQGEPFPLTLLRHRAERKFQIYGLNFNEGKFAYLLNNLRKKGLINNSTSSEISLNPAENIMFIVPPRLLAVWSDDIEFIRKDIIRSIREESVLDTLRDYSEITSMWGLYPVEAKYPVLRAVAILEETDQTRILDAIKSGCEGKKRPPLLDAIFLMLDPVNGAKNWLRPQTPALEGRTVYSVAAEITLLAGGLGRVMHYHGTGLKELGADVVYIEPMYRRKKDGSALNYYDPSFGLKDLKFCIKLNAIVQGKRIEFDVFSGINENGIRVYFIKDIQNGSYSYADILYTYRSKDNPNAVPSEEFTEFFGKASLELIKYLELQKRRDMGDSWKPPIVDANDGQALPLCAFRRIFYLDEKTVGRETAEIFSRMLVCGTTHTYRNRVKIWDFEEGLRFLRSAGVGPEWLWLFLKKEDGGQVVWDFTSAGLRAADIAKGVSAVHAYEVGEWDPGILLYGITNGDNRLYSARYFIESMRELGMSELKYNSLTPEETAKIKRKAKEKLGLNPGQLAVSYSGRLVDEKAGRENALTNGNIEEMVRNGIQVVIYGNVQPYAESRKIADELREFERTVNGKNYPGRFIFRGSFSIDEQQMLLAATDVQVQYSTRKTGASEYTEADVTANGGLQLSPPYWEGIIGKQGLPVNWDLLEGNTIVPRDDSPRAFIEAVLHANGKYGTGELFKLQAQSIKLSRVLDALNTSAEFLRFWNDALEKGTRAEPMPRALGEFTESNIRDIQMNPGSGCAAERRQDGFNISGKGKFKLSVRIDLNVDDKLNQGRRESIPHEAARARIVDKYGRIIYLNNEGRQGNEVIFAVELEGGAIDGKLEISSGLWWVKRPFNTTRTSGTNIHNQIQAGLKGQFKVTQISPNKRVVNKDTPVVTNDNYPVVLDVEFPWQFGDFIDDAAPVLYTNTGGKWADAPAEQVLFSDLKYKDGRFRWTLGFAPDGVREFTFYVTLKSNPALKVWFGGDGENILVFNPEVEARERQDVSLLPNFILQVNTREAGSLARIKKHLREWRRIGIDTVYLLGVCPVSPLSKDMNRGDNREGNLYKRKTGNNGEVVVYETWGGDKNRNAGSMFSIVDFGAVEQGLGGTDGLKQVITEAHELGMKIVIDFVPEHTGIDHPWVSEKTDYYVKREIGQDERNLSGEDLLKKYPDYFIYRYPDGRKVLIHHGKDPYFKPWKDTAKLNYENRELCGELISILKFWAELGADGVRCDMAHLVPDSFWGEAISKIKETHSDFIFIAETYEIPVQGRLQGRGFDLTYHKEVYDKLNSPADALNHIIRTDPGLLQRSVLFTGNHDEDWHVAMRLMSASVLVSTLPGAPLFYLNQLVGQGQRREIQRVEPYAAMMPDDFYKKLITAVRDPIFRKGEFIPLRITNPNLLAFARKLGDRICIVAVNLTSSLVSGTVYMPQGINFNGDEIIILEDRLNEREYIKKGRDINNGLPINLGPDQSHIFFMHRLAQNAEWGAKPKDVDLGESYKKITALAGFIFPNLECPAFEILKSLEGKEAEMEKDFSLFTKAKGHGETLALLSLIGEIIEGCAPEMPDEMKYRAALALADRLLKTGYALPANQMQLLWHELSQIGYAKDFADIAAALVNLKTKKFTELTKDEQTLLYFVCLLAGKDARRIFPYEGIDYTDGIAEGGNYTARIKNNILQWKMIDGRKGKKYSGAIVQDVRDFGAGVNNWLRGMANYKVDIDGVRMVYLLSGLGADEREQLMRHKPKNAVFLEKIEDVEGENIVYLTKTAGGQIDGLKKKGIKVVERGNCGAALELSFAVDLLSVKNMYAAEGRLSEEVLNLYAEFLSKMNEFSMIDSQTQARCAAEIREYGYIKLPKIQRFENMWNNEMPLQLDVYA